MQVTVNGYFCQAPRPNSTPWDKKPGTTISAGTKMCKYLGVLVDRALAPKTEREYRRFRPPSQLPLFLASVVSSAFPVIARHDSVGAGPLTKKIFPKYIDTTSALGINFRNMAARTSKKYLIETMRPGMALFDYDNDGRLDIFVVNGAPLAAQGSSGPKYWNRLYHQKQDGTSEDVTQKLACRESRITLVYRKAL